MTTVARRIIMEKVKELKGTALEEPHGGWIRTIRNSLGMTTTQLAKRIGISQSALTLHEKREKTGSIKIQTLRKIATALNCKLAYSFVPNENLERFIERKAMEKALEILKTIEHTMALENQSISKNESHHQLQELIKELKNNPKKIWENNV